ncbi:hypothetical protein VTK26DRAFT_2066 [Humicola hyalothermophila]
MPHSVSPAAEAQPNSSPPSTAQLQEDSGTMATRSPRTGDDIQMADVGGLKSEVEEQPPTTETAVAHAESDAEMPDIGTEKKPETKLEDLFDDIDSDDDDFGLEPPPSPPVVPDHSAATTELLRTFYQRFFPWRYMYQWLNHSPTPTNDIKHREFSLRLPSDAMLRYQSYTTSDQFRKDVLRLMPTRIEIGPVYTADPRDRKVFRNSTAFRPLAKELCFDIDLTDYDDIRTCCDQANICNKCWRFMTMAIKVLDTGLREDFGFQHILWVYSGRRGVHAWVCDKKARELDDFQRKAITGYFNVVTGSKQSGKRVNLRRPLHPHLSRSLDILKEHFQKDVLQTQDPWSDPEKSAYLLQLIPDADLRRALESKWDSSSPPRSSAEKWADIDELAQTGASKALDPRDLLDAKQDIVLEHTYPRLDAAVTQKLNHLLKSPFVVHPGTGRVCVPIDTRALDEFDPFDVPTLAGLVRDVDAWAEEHAGAGEVDGEGAAGVQDWEKTRLKPYIEYFRSFVLTLMKDEREAVVKRERVDAEVKKEGGMDDGVKMESLDF